MMPATPSAASTANQTHMTGPNRLPTRVGAVRLDHEQRDQDDDGAGHDEGLQLGRHHLQAFDGAQHGDRRRDQAVAVEEGDADDREADDEQRLRPLALARRRARAASERMPPSPRLSARVISRTYLIVTTMTRAQNISESTPSTALSRARQTGGGGDRSAQCVDRAGADVAIDDAERADDQRPLVP